MKLSHADLYPTVRRISPPETLPLGDRLSARIVAVTGGGKASWFTKQ